MHIPIQRLKPEPGWAGMGPIAENKYKFQHSRYIILYIGGLGRCWEVLGGVGSGYVGMHNIYYILLLDDFFLGSRLDYGGWIMGDGGWGMVTGRISYPELGKFPGFGGKL